MGSHSQQFIDVLKSINYPDVDKLTPESIDWLFENEETEAFLNWIGSCISEDNLIQEAEFSKCASHETLNQLRKNESKKSSLSECPHPLRKEQLQSDVEDLRNSLEASKVTKTNLVKRCNKVSVEQIALRDKVGKMEKVEEQWKRQRQQAEEKCRAENIQLSQALQQLTESVDNMIGLYQAGQADGRPGRPKSGTAKMAATREDTHFLSQMELEAFHEAEAKFCKELTAFTKKQFFVGMSDMAGEREDCDYKLLDLSSAGLTSPHEGGGDGGDSFHADCLEFTRLQSIFPRSECARINALVNAKKAASAVQEASTILHQLKSHVFPTEPKSIIQLRHSTEQSVASAKASSSPLLSSVPDLIQELGSLQGTEVLTGDYALKLRRQDYFMASQDKVIGHLVTQRARSEFLDLLFDLELRWHQETHGLLCAALQALESHLGGWQARMTEMDELDLTEKKFERSVVDTRDKSTGRLYKLIGESREGSHQLYLPLEEVLTQARGLKSDVDTALSQSKGRQEQDEGKVHQLHQCVKEEENLLYTGSTTATFGLPNLTPAPIQATLTQVTNHLLGLKDKVMAAVDQVNTKKQELRSNILQKKERELYVLFHTNPDKLKYVVNGLAEKVKALEVQNS